MQQDWRENYMRRIRDMAQEVTPVRSKPSETKPEEEPMSEITKIRVMPTGPWVAVDENGHEVANGTKAACRAAATRRAESYQSAGIDAAVEVLDKAGRPTSLKPFYADRQAELPKAGPVEEEDVEEAKAAASRERSE